MQTLGLSRADFKAYVAALSKSYVMTANLRVLTMDGDLVTTIRPVLESGQVNIDTDADVTRSATLSFLDPGHALQFSPDSPADGAVYFNNMVQVRVTVYVEALASTVHCDVFTGPITKFDRTAELVSIEAQGIETLGLTGCPTITIRKGHNAVDAIHDILAQRVGETRFSFPSGISRKLNTTVHASWDDDHVPWKVCKGIAATLGMQLFYDGAGVCRLRDLPGSSAYRFKTGAGGNITAPLAVSHDKSELRNQVVVTGKVTGKKKNHPGVPHVGTANLPNWHPASSLSLARNGQRHYLREAISDDRIVSTSVARSRASNQLARYDRLTFGSTFNALPVFPLDELDLVTIDTDEYQSRERVRQLSFPITGGDMTVGYNDLVSVPRNHRRKP